MPSVGIFKAQPVTRTFIVTQDAGNNEYGAYYFTESDIDSWYSANSDNVTKVTSGLYIVNSGNFANTVQDLSNTGVFERKRSLIDMGKEVVIGNVVNSRLLVLRKVQEAIPPADGGDGIVGYVVVESNYRSANWPTPSNSELNVNVARV
jgi:hypothetical protein